jgi:hypothetical protein
MPQKKETGGQEEIKQGRICISYFKVWLFIRPESPERGGPCILLKRRQMGTLIVQIKGILPWLVCWARLAGTRDLYPALAALVSPVQHIFSLTVHYFNFYVFPSFPATWACSRAGPPVSECVYIHFSASFRPCLHCVT